jgi:hypothetical protein
MANEPTLKRGHPNDAQWVSHAQQMLNLARTPMDIDHLAESGTFDAETERTVHAFQQRVGLQLVDGIVGPDTWAALWEVVTERQQERAAAGEAAAGTAPAAEHAPQEHHDGGGHGGQAQHGGHAEGHDAPPTYHDVDRGRELIHYYVGEVVERANAFAESVDKLGPPNEVLPKLIDGGHTAVDLAEILGAAEESVAIGQALFVASVAGTILVPFTMWYEAIAANNAGDLHTYRWQVYNPFMAGFLGGLYGQAAAEVDHLFVPVRDHAFKEAANLSPADKKGVIALLLAVSSAMDYIPDESNPTMSAEHWALAGMDAGYTAQGLEIEISKLDS